MRVSSDVRKFRMAVYYGSEELTGRSKCSEIPNTKI